MILTLYETFAAQILVTKLQQTKTNKSRKKHSSKWVNHIGTVIMDERHCLKNMHTNFYASIKHLQAEYH